MVHWTIVLVLCMAALTLGYALGHATAMPYLARLMADRKSFYWWDGDQGVQDEKRDR